MQNCLWMWHLLKRSPPDRHAHHHRCVVMPIIIGCCMLSCPSYVGCCVYHVSAQTICLSAIARPTAADPYLIVIMIMMMMIMMKMKIIRRTLIMVQFTKVSTIVNYHRSCVLYFCLLSECNCSNWSISLCFDVADYDDNHHVTMIVSSSSISKVLGVFFFGYWGRGPSTKVVQCPGCNLRLHDDLFISIYMSIQSSTI